LEKRWIQRSEGLVNMNKINKQQIDSMSRLLNNNFDIIRNTLPDFTKINQAIEKITIPDSVFKGINELALVRENFILSLQPMLEQQQALSKICMQSAKQIEKFYKGIASTGIFLELSKLQKLNLELFTSNLPNIESTVLSVLEKDLYFSELALQPKLPEENEKSEELIEIDLSISLETERKLEIIDPVFVRMYRGAVEVYVGGNVDGARHVLISLRELFMRLLNKLCPNEQVIAWIGGLDDKPENYFIEDKPSRKAKMNYYYRNEKGDGLEKFVNNKILFLESCINASNSVHEDLDNISSSQLANFIRAARYLIDDLLSKNIK